MANFEENPEQNSEPSGVTAKDSRRAFIAKASVGGIASVGAILGMAESVAAEKAIAKPVVIDRNANAEQRILSRATTDSNFRKQLISDPRKVISEEMGMMLRDDLKIMVLEENIDTVYIVLPFIAPEEQIRLSNAELGTGVAGLGSKPKSKHHCKCSSLSVCGSK